MTPKEFVRRLAELHTPNTFNPYSEICDVFDLKDAHKIRKQLLFEILTKASKVEIDAIWIGRDLGHRGGRRTGLALTDEVNASAHARRWSLDAQKTTKGALTSERTASVIWDMLNQIQSNIFLWNVFPLHPFEGGKPFSNRSHNTTEKKLGEAILFELINLLKPTRLIAVGNDASSSSIKLEKTASVLKVRHPSYGGQNIFIDQISIAYELKKKIIQQDLFL